MTRNIHLRALMVLLTICAAFATGFAWALFCYWLTDGSLWGIALSTSPFLIGGSYSLAKVTKP